MSTTPTVDLSQRPVIVFDFDGTLADTPPAIIRTANTVLREFGVPKERLVDTPKLVGPPFPQAFSQVFGLSAEDAQTVTNRYRAIYETLGADGWPPFPGIPELLRELHDDGRRLAVASSKRTGLLRRSVEDCGFADLFELVQGKQSDAPQTKAQTLGMVLGELGVRPDEAVMVGDRHYDIDAAHEVGLPGVGVLYGHTAPREELEQAGAAAIAATVGDLHRILMGVGD